MSKEIVLNIYVAENGKPTLEGILSAFSDKPKQLSEEDQEQQRQIAITQTANF